MIGVIINTVLIVLWTIVAFGYWCTDEQPNKFTAGAMAALLAFDAFIFLLDAIPE